MLPALQLLRLDFPAAGAVETLRDHPTSRLRSVQIHGRQDCHVDPPFFGDAF